MNELSSIVRFLTAPNCPGGVLATLVTVEGSSYRRPGARLLVVPAGDRIGSISGGCLEEDVLARARAVAASGRADLVLYDTTSENDLVWGVGLGCHGIVQVLLERVPPRPAWAAALAANLAARRPTQLATVWRAGDAALLGTRIDDSIHAVPSGTAVFRQVIAPPVALTVFGAGDDARPLVRAARDLGWQVTVADQRPPFATAARFPEAHACIVAPAEKLVAAAGPESGSLAVVMTHHYLHDVPVLRDLLPRPLAYIGLLGPRKRAEKILEDLTARGLAVTTEMRARLHAPVGLDIGAETPDEVALSILAEIQTVLARRDGRPLRERQKPIHSV